MTEDSQHEFGHSCSSPLRLRCSTTGASGEFAHCLTSGSATRAFEDKGANHNRNDDSCDRPRNGIAFGKSFDQSGNSPPSRRQDGINSQKLRDKRHDDLFRKEPSFTGLREKRSRQTHQTSLPDENTSSRHPMFHHDITGHNCTESCRRCVINSSPACVHPELICEIYLCSSRFTPFLFDSAMSTLPSPLKSAAWN